MPHVEADKETGDITDPLGFVMIDMGNGAAKRKRVKGSDMANKRKRYISPPVKLKGCSASDSDVASATIEMMGFLSSDSDVESATIEMMGFLSSDSDVESATIEMMGFLSSDSDDVASATIEMKGCSAGDTADVSPPRKRVESLGCSANDGEQPGGSHGGSGVVDVVVEEDDFWILRYHLESWM
ncbi:hypothetical protein Tco_1502684 [Tanacetum coccineum]